MTTTALPPAADPRLDRLYALLPTVQRQRDADQGYPLKALLRVIAEQVNVVDDDLARLYENWFIETADDWAVPYIGALVGYAPVAEGGLPPDAPRGERARVLVPRREVANEIRNRRAKGTPWLLEQLAQDVAGWPARVVEYFRLLVRNQQIDHLWMQRHRIADLRDVDALDRLGTPLDTIAHGVDVRRIDSHRRVGRHDIASVGLFVWRLLSLPVTRTPAYCVEEVGPNCYTFSVLGQDAPLFVAPQRETDPTSIADEMNLPAPIRRAAFAAAPSRYLGDGASLAIYVEGWAGAPDGPVPLAAIMPADLSGWQYEPPGGRIAVDPVLGRIAFPPNQLAKKGVRVDYRYGFPAAIGGGEYARALRDPAGDFTLYRVGDGEAYALHRIGDALARWRAEQPTQAVIELCSSAVYVEPIAIELADGQSLQLRAASRVRPVIRLIDWQTDLPDALSVTLGAASRCTLDGLLVTGRALAVQGREGAPAAICGARLTIRHCTLVPGWGIACDCAPRRPAEPSLELTGLRASVEITQSIVGAIRVAEDAVMLDPLTIRICDSIVDATAPERQAIGAPGDGIAHALLTLRNVTVFGIVDVHAIELAENSLFTACVNVARRQIGCMRHCYVPCGCRTPRRYHCQPDGVIAAARAAQADPVAQAAAIEREKSRVVPQFTSRRYGTPAYAQLGRCCAVEIQRGADDESELGVYHDLFQPQREARLRARLADATPAGMDVGLILAN
ncbi:MAG: hypothetical protein KGL18_20510 [Burkholderiales bacterium]|nr:hypothetical protein [Burkholderiales bacterium]MDE1926034.1 hypothetical protein [Burkholderiales bacterium]MDE2159833.1 hypothetical protein [Burkholderiales bacterium]MDE2505352.1 hypothetical protein [Burkholderiales bacterium]